MNDKQIYTQINELVELRYISIAKNGEFVVVNKIGKVQGLSNKAVNVNLKNVLYIPNFRKNLLSVSRIVEAGIKVNFNKNEAVLEKDGKIIATAKIIEIKLYEIKFKILRSVSNLSKSETDILWHRRMGHIGKQCYNDLVKHDMAKGLPKQIEIDYCEVCIQCKQCRSPFDGTRTIASRPIEHVHSDVCDPINSTTFNDLNYFVSFIDDYTHFAHVYFLKNKSESFDKFKEYKFIEIGVTIAYTPQQNGVAKKFNRTITEKVRTLTAVVKIIVPLVNLMFKVF